MLESARLSFFDYLQRNHEPSVSEQIVLVDIDEKTLDEFGQYPFPRDFLATELSKASDSIIGINILMSEKDRAGGDAMLADALFDMNAIVAIAPSNRTKTSFRPQPIGVAVFGERDAVEFRTPLDGMLFAQPDIMSSAIGYGTISSAQDVDGIVRRTALIENFEGRLYPAFALDILRVAAGDISYQISTDDYGIEFVRIPKFKEIKTDEYGNVNIAFWNEFKRYSFTELDQIPPGSIAIIGATFAGSTVLSTPLGAMYPHDVQASLLKTMIDGVTITRPPEFAVYEMAATAVISLIIIFLLLRAPIIVSGLLFLLVTVGIVVFAVDTFNTYFMLIDPVYPVVSLVLMMGHGSFVQFYTQFKLKQQIKGQFGTYLSPDMVDMLVKDPSLMRLGGDRKEMSFLFMDICGFTPISEFYKNKDDPEGLVELVNDYLNQMTNIILKHGGTIDKYMGDCIMAFWNAPLPCDNHAEMAVRAAMEIEATTKQLQQHYEDMGLPPINVGTGINTGDCIVGNMGSETRFDYSVIGDAVNLAARLEATAARHEYIEYKTIFSSFTNDQLPDSIKTKEIGNIKVKGKDELITIYSFG
jgi:adenylate cyclase